MRIQTALLWLLVMALLWATACGGAYLSVHCFVRLVGQVGITHFIVILAGTTVAMVILFLIDLERLSARYKQVNQDGWFMFVKAAVLGIALGLLLTWLSLFKAEILPVKYIWILLVLFILFAFLVDRNERSRKHKRFPDINALLKKKD